MPPALITIAEWLAVLLNIVYVIFAARNDRRAWPPGFVAAILSMLVFVHFKFYSDALLQIYYAIVAIYAFFTWQPTEEVQRPIVRWGLTQHLGLIVLGLVMTLLAGRFWVSYNAAVPYGDAFTTSFALIATWLTARRVLVNWIYWIVVNTVAIYLYVTKGIYGFAVLYGIFWVFSFIGFNKWSHIYRRQAM